MSLAVHRYLFIVLGYLSLLVGIIGIFLPILPTTPLVILAAYFFSKGSKKVHLWLTTNPYFGKMISNWETYRVIPIWAKVWSTVIIIPLFTFTFVFVQVHEIIKLIVLVIGVYALYFIWKQKSTYSNSSR